MEIIEIQDAAIEYLTHEGETDFGGHPSRLYGFSGERPHGLHLSDILQDLYLRVNPKYKQERSKRGGEPIWSVGLGWEHMLSWSWSKVFPDQGDRIVHLGAFQKDGIWMTPDRIDTVWPGIIEMKCTWKSLRKGALSEQWLWQRQAMAYCLALEFCQARFYVLYLMELMGLWGGEKIGPKCWEIKFTRGELERNWQMVTAHRDLMLKEGWKK